MAIGIRRLDDRDPSSISLARLIQDAAEHPTLVSREHYRSLYAETYPGDDWMQRRADEEYDDYVGPGAESLTAEIATRDLDQLKAAGSKIRHHVNKHVAHTDERAGPATATYIDLDEALDGVTALYRRYSLLIKGSAPTVMAPTLQFDWKQPFLVAWQPDDDYLEALRRQGQVPREEPGPKER
jgi:hypothetical protein